VNSTNYVLGFILAMTAVVAILLTGLREVTKAGAERNDAIFNKRAVLMSVENNVGGKTVSELSDSEVEAIFQIQVEQRVLNMEGEEVESMMAEDIDMAKERKKPEAERVLPLFIYTDKDTKEEFYILSVRGTGLWDEIWGNIALESDFETVAGAAFDHKGETPGLGAEIKDNPSFRKQFEGKKIYDKSGNYTAVVVRKNGAVNDRYEVDGISGATVTANGVTEMLKRGIKYYQPYLEKLKSGSEIQGYLVQ
jgi:Na+-transporting NADH:ubiquinone oxidoreductase subunit C